MVARREDRPGPSVVMEPRPFEPGERVLLDEIDARIRALLAERLRIAGTADRDARPLETVSEVRGAAARLLVGRAMRGASGHCCRLCDLAEGGGEGQAGLYTVEAALAHVLVNHPAAVRAVVRSAVLTTLAAADAAID